MLRVLTNSKNNFLEVGSLLLQAQGLSWQVQSDVKSGEGDVMLVMGTKNLKKYQDAGLVPKGRVVRSLRATVHEIKGRHVVFTYDPYMVTKDYQTRIDIEWDIQLAYRVAKYGTAEPQIGHYEYVPGFNKLIGMMEANRLNKEKVESSLDLETVGLNEYDPEAFIVSISVTTEKGMAHIIRFKGLEDQPARRRRDGTYEILNQKLYDQIQFLLTSENIKTCGANLKYDMRWLRWKWGMICTNFTFDTTLVGSLLDENASNSLNSHAKRYTNMGGYDDYLNSRYDKGRMDLVPDEHLLTYAGGDTDAALQVMHYMRGQLLQDPQLVRFYVKLLHPAVRAFEGIESEGILIDVDHYTKLQYEVVQNIEECEEKAVGLMTNFLKNKYAGIDGKGLNNLRLSRGVVIKDFMFGPRGLGLKPRMFTEKTGEPSTAIAHLLMFEDDPKAKTFIDALKEHNSAKKTLSTYIVGFMKHLKPDGRFHPTFLLYKGAYGNDEDSGTVTGRSSAKDPAVQTIPKHTKWAKKLRAGYIAPEDYVIVEWDFSQGELRIAAVVAQEQTMIGLYNQGLDQHMITGGKMAGYSVDDMLAMKQGDPALYKKLRQSGKAGNFGLLYGMQTKGFREYSRITFGVQMTMDEAEEKRQSFFDLYPRLPVWHQEQINFAKTNGYVRSPLGRLRHLPMINSNDNELRSQAERQSINSPIQATLSDLSIYSLAKFREGYGEPDTCKFFLFTHDSITAYVRRDTVGRWVPEVKNLMETLPFEEDFGWQVPLKFVSDAEIGVKLSDLTEYDLWLAKEHHKLGH